MPSDSTRESCTTVTVTPHLTTPGGAGRVVGSTMPGTSSEMRSGNRPGSIFEQMFNMVATKGRGPSDPPGAPTYGTTSRSPWRKW